MVPEEKIDVLYKVLDPSPLINAILCPLSFHFGRLNEERRYTVVSPLLYSTVSPLCPSCLSVVCSRSTVTPVLIRTLKSQGWQRTVLVLRSTSMLLSIRRDRSSSLFSRRLSVTNPVHLSSRWSCVLSLLRWRGPSSVVSGCPQV